MQSDTELLRLGKGVSMEKLLLELAAQAAAYAMKVILHGLDTSI